MAQELTQSRLLQLAGTILNYTLSGSDESLKDFRAHFGMAPGSVINLWFRIDQAMRIPVGAKPIHLLWALLHLKVYGSQTVMARMCKTNRKTFRKWVKKMVRAIHSIASRIVSRCCCAVVVLLMLSNVVVPSIHLL
jgi:hypothetical protein